MVQFTLDPSGPGVHGQLELSQINVGHASSVPRLYAYGKAIDGTSVSDRTHASLRSQQTPLLISSTLLVGSTLMLMCL
jgi:hypothetical protein